MKSNLNAVDFIKKVGKGKTLSKSLTEIEARQAMSLLLNQGFSVVQFGAFLQALRIKELSQEELNGFFAVCFEYTKDKSLPAFDFVINLASDTPRKAGLLSLLACALLIKKKYRVGVVYSDPVLSQNSRSFSQTLALSQQFFFEKSSDEKLSSYLFPCSQLLENWSQWNTLRGELGFRSCLHTLEKMFTPDQQAKMLIGISHKGYAPRMLQALAAQNIEAQIVLGNHGTIDFLFHKPTVVVQLSQGEVVERTIDPSLLQLKLPTSLYSLAAFDDWEKQLDDLNSVLWQAVYFQAAGMLYLNQKTNTIGDAWDLVRA